MEVDEPPAINVRRPTGDLDPQPIDSEDTTNITRDAGAHFAKSRATPGLEADLAGMPGGSASPTARSYDKRQKSPSRTLGIPGPEDHKIWTRDYSNPHVRLLSEFTIRVDGGLDLEGQHIARIADKIHAEDYHALVGDHLVRAIEGDLEPNLKGFFHKSKQYFLPLTVLHGVLTTHTVLRLLQHLNEREGSPRQEEYLSLSPIGLRHRSILSATQLNSFGGRLRHLFSPANKI